MAKVAPGSNTGDGKHVATGDAAEEFRVYDRLPKRVRVAMHSALFNRHAADCRDVLDSGMPVSYLLNMLEASDQMDLKEDPPTVIDVERLKDALLKSARRMKPRRRL